MLLSQGARLGGSAAGLHLPATQRGQSQTEDQPVPRAAGVGKASRTGREDLIG